MWQAVMNRMRASGRLVAASGAAILSLGIYGVFVTTRAMWVLAHGGNQAFDGAFDYPRWSAVHFAAAFAFVIILPFQLSSWIRAAAPRMHRVAGRIAAASGLAFALTGLALPLAMPARPFGERTFMMVAGCLFLFLIWRGVAAARRRDFVTHRLWMLRVTALALGPLTQRVMLPFFAAAGIDSMARFWDLFVTTLWLSAVLNFVIAEWWIRRTDAPALPARSVVREHVAAARLSAAQPSIPR